MKTKIFLKISTYLGVILLLVSSCNKDFGDGEPIDYKSTVLEKINTDPKYSFFKELYQFHDSITNSTRPAVIPSGTRIPTLAGSLGSSYITAFIPTNDVYIASGVNYIKNAGVLNPALNKFISVNNAAGPITIDLLRQYLGNHINTRPTEEADFGVFPRLRTLGGFANDSLFLSSLNNEFYINSNAKVDLQSKSKSKNGNLYSIGKLLTPVYNGQFIQAIAVDTSLSLFSQALVRANTPADALINGSANTATIRASVFAPTNQAFRDAGITSASITSMPIATLKLLIQNHIIRQRIFSNELVSGPLTMINSRTITLSVSGGNVSITSPGSATTPAVIVNPNILVVRGVIHKINKVLTP